MRVLPVINCRLWSPNPKTGGGFCAGGHHGGSMSRGVCVNTCRLGQNTGAALTKAKPTPRTPTDEELRRAAICVACDAARGITLQQDPPVYSVKCADCGCGGVKLATGDCPRRKWTMAAQCVEIACDLPPGDVVMLTAAVRDLHAAYPGQFRTAIKTKHPALWRHNPLAENVESFSSYRRIEASYTRAIQESNQRPYHFIDGYAQDLAVQLGVPRYPIREFRGDVRMSDRERRSWPSSLGDWRGPYWLVYAGGKYDITAKWWSPDNYQGVIDALRGRVQFVQVGSLTDFHNRLDGVIDLTGKTDLRELIHLTYHAAGVVCPVTLGMHLAAAVPTPDGDGERTRPCVVIAGGREPRHWEAYPGHAFLDNVGQLSCSDKGGCWKTRCQPVGDGDEKDAGNRCVQPVGVTLRMPVIVRDRATTTLDIPRCMTMIGVSDVVKAIRGFESR